MKLSLEYVRSLRAELKGAAGLFVNEEHLNALLDAAEKQFLREGRRAVVQGERERGIGAGTVSWEVHLLAWSGYDAAGHGDQSAERINQRGGFSYGEIQCALAGHYNQCGHCKVEHPPVPTWEPGR